MVLDVQPENVKALFRTGKVSVYTGKMQWFHFSTWFKISLGGGLKHERMNLPANILTWTIFTKLGIKHPWVNWIQEYLFLIKGNSLGVIHSWSHLKCFIVNQCEMALWFVMRLLKFDCCKKLLLTWVRHLPMGLSISDLSVQIKKWHKKMLTMLYKLSWL